jgi:hypothetical protein
MYWAEAKQRYELMAVSKPPSVLLFERHKISFIPAINTMLTKY